MSTPIITIEEDKSVEEAMGILNKHKINRLPVVHHNSIIGIVTTEMIMSNVSIEKHGDSRALNSFCHTYVAGQRAFKGESNSGKP